MIIPLKNIVENLEEPLKSPRRKSPELTQRYKMGKKYESSQLNNYIRAFRKEIQLPINYQTSIFLSKTPQRCLNHNSVITLFCLDDKKPLCAHCMYQAFSHKKHQIVPIDKVTNILKQQIQNSLQSIVCAILPKINQFKTKNEIRMAKISKQIHDHIFVVNKFYQDLASFIMSKKNQHIKYCQQVQNRFKNEHHSFQAQLNKTLQFLQDKVKKISQRNTDENLLFNHNTAFYLKKVDSILVPSILQFPPLQTKEIQQKIETIRKDLNEVLNQNFKLLKMQERKKSLQKTESVPKNQKFMLWKSKSPQILRQQGQNFYSKTSLHQRYSYKDIPKSLFTQRQQHLKDKKSSKKQRKSKDNKPSFIFNQKQIQEEFEVKQQSTLQTKLIKSKKQQRRILTSKDR